MNTASKVFRTVFTHSLFFVSEISLVRFLIRQQLVCKYRTPALSMKSSLYTILYTIPYHTILYYTGDKKTAFIIYFRNMIYTQQMKMVT